MTEKEITLSNEELKDYIKEIVDAFKKDDFNIMERYSFHPKQTELILKYIKEKHPDLYEKYDSYKKDWPNRMWRK